MDATFISQHVVYCSCLLLRVLTVFRLKRSWVMMYNYQGKGSARYQFKVACSIFRRTHSRGETQGVCLALQISPGRGEAGVALQGAKSLHLRGNTEGEFQREAHKNRWRVLSLRSTPTSALLCLPGCREGERGTIFTWKLQEFQNVFNGKRWVKFNFFFLFFFFWFAPSS